MTPKIYRMLVEAIEHFLQAHIGFAECRFYLRGSKGFPHSLFLHWAIVAAEPYLAEVRLRMNQESITGLLQNCAAQWICLRWHTSH